MKTMDAQLVVIGGGPAGMAAAVRAREQGIGDILLLERDVELGGILNQCIHDGFGLLRFGKQLSGAQYAQVFADMVQEGNIRVLTSAMVTNLTADKQVYLTHREQGSICINAGAVILAMGCRERTRSQVGIMGTRPAGILTAGAVQKYINISGYLPGRKAVILGSGDIGLIMARRMTLEGMEVEGVYEVMPGLGGLRRNKVQCLDDYGIPLHLSTTVVETHGNKRLEGVTVAQVDDARKPVPGSERYIPCDLLVLSVGLIPENELSREAGIALHPITNGPIVDCNMMTSIPGVFAAGNVSAVFDLVDYVSETGELAAAGAAQYLNGLLDNRSYAVQPGENVSFVLPQRIRPGGGARLFLRVNRTMEDVRLVIRGDGRELAGHRHQVATPPEMLSVSLDGIDFEGDITVSVEETG